MFLFVQRFFSVTFTFLVVIFLSYKVVMALDNKDIRVQAEKFAINESNMILSKAKTCSTEAQFISFLKHEIQQTVAINYMALWVLGNNKTKFTSEQFNRFILAFQNHLTEFYGSILFQNRNKTFTFKNSRSLGDYKARVEFVVPLEKQILLIEWQLRLDPRTDKLLVTDFIVNGISFLQAKRTEYNAFFKQSGCDPEKFLKMFIKSNEMSKANIKNLMPK